MVPLGDHVGNLGVLRGFGVRWQRVEVIRTPPFRLPKLLADHKAQVNKAAECATNLAQGHRKERKTLLQVAEQVTGGKASERHPVNNTAGPATVTGNNADPKADLVKAKRLEGTQRWNLGARHKKRPRQNGRERGVDVENPTR